MNLPPLDKVTTFMPTNMDADQGVPQPPAPQLDRRVEAFLDRNTLIQDFAIGSYVKEDAPPRSFRSQAAWRGTLEDDDWEEPPGASLLRHVTNEWTFRTNDEWTQEWDFEKVLKDLEVQNQRAMMYLYDPTEENLRRTFEPLQKKTEHSGRSYLVAPAGYHKNRHIFPYLPSDPYVKAEMYSPTDMHFVVEKVRKLKWTPMVINKQMLDLYRRKKWENLHGALTSHRL